MRGPKPAPARPLSALTLPIPHFYLNFLSLQRDEKPQFEKATQGIRSSFSLRLLDTNPHDEPLRAAPGGQPHGAPLLVPLLPGA